ncbi:MAG: hypothetical protein ACRD8W_26815 [Nitrososphaeraceae archaeon]
MNGGVGSTAPIVEEFIFPLYFIFGREIDGAPPLEIPVIPNKPVPPELGKILPPNITNKCCH